MLTAEERRYHREYYARNREKRRAQLNVAHADSRIRNRRVLAEYRAGHPCVDCGEANPVVLDFDHVRDTKRNDVSKLASSGASVARLMAEIAKCEVRCVNCHRRVTVQRRGTQVGRRTSRREKPQSGLPF